MARNRMIKPEFWTSDQVVECSHSARLLFIGLWNFSDDAGNHPDSVKRLKREIFPSDDLTVEQMGGLLSELIDQGLVARYFCGDKDFLHVTGWIHQRIDKPTYKYPPHDGGANSTTTLRILPDPSKPNEKKRNETKGNEEKRNQLRTAVTDVRRDLEIDWGEVDKLIAPLVAKIEKAWGAVPQGNFREKFGKAGACVVAGVLPECWLADAIGEMITGQRKRSPVGWLGKVLATTAKERGVDFDAYQRAIQIPEKE